MVEKKRETPKAVIVLAMHGSPPLDFPEGEMTEFMGLHARLGHQHTRGERAKPSLRSVGGQDAGLAADRPKRPLLRRVAGAGQAPSSGVGARSDHRVNEFCAPTLDEALERAAAGKPEGSSSSPR